MNNDAGRIPPPIRHTSVSRREAIGQMTVGVMAFAVGGCLKPGTAAAEAIATAAEGRITARPHEPTETIAPGRSALGIGRDRDGLLYVPKSYKPATAAPLVVLLHGAGQSSDELIDPMMTMADEVGMVLAAPDSRGSSWDIRYGAFGPDIAFIDTMLEMIFKKTRIDAARVRVCGFSDGASYSLSIGTLNGDLFGKIVAMSPGYMVGSHPVGKPSIFITHGTQDTVLPIDRTSRVLVPRLRSAGYAVEYHEFDGRHMIPLPLLHDATVWMAAV